MNVDYDKIKFRTLEINRNFKIKVYGMMEGKRIDRAVGVHGLCRIVGDYGIVNSMLERAFNARADKVICKLRRGLKITFYSH
jgi:hypothetical protein